MVSITERMIERLEGEGEGEGFGDFMSADILSKITRYKVTFF